MKARIAEDGSGSERRRAERHDIEIDAQVREMGAEGQEARLLNISESGFMADVPEAHFEVGSRIWLLLPNRDRASAIVKWIAGSKLGAEFAEPISLEGLDR